MGRTGSDRAAADGGREYTREMVTHATPLRHPATCRARRVRKRVDGDTLTRMTHETDGTDGTEIELQCGTWRAVVSSHGASLRGVTHCGRPVVTGYHGTAAKQGGQGDVLIPFGGRVKAGRYTWDGITHQLPITDKDGPNAIHGFVRMVPWTVELREAHVAVFSLEFAGAEGYPFPLRLRLAYTLDDAGLHVACAISNTGVGDAPVAMGFHPYFTVGSALVDTDAVTLPFDEVLEFEQLIPTGRVLGVDEGGLDFRGGRVVGDTTLNHCFAAPRRDHDGRTRVRLAGADRALTVWMDEAFGYVVIYTGEALPPALRRTCLAIEPMSGGSDAFNHPAWGLHRLAPGATFHGTWGVSAG